MGKVMKIDQNNINNNIYAEIIIINQETNTAVRNSTSVNNAIADLAYNKQKTFNPITTVETQETAELNKIQYRIAGPIKQKREYQTFDFISNVYIDSSYIVKQSAEVQKQSCPNAINIYYTTTDEKSSWNTTYIDTNNQQFDPSLYNIPEVRYNVNSKKFELSSESITNNLNGFTKIAYPQISQDYLNDTNIINHLKTLEQSINVGDELSLTYKASNLGTKTSIVYTTVCDVVNRQEVPPGSTLQIVTTGTNIDGAKIQIVVDTNLNVSAISNLYAVRISLAYADNKYKYNTDIVDIQLSDNSAKIITDLGSASDEVKQRYIKSTSTYLHKIKHIYYNSDKLYVFWAPYQEYLSKKLYVDIFNINDKAVYSNTKELFDLEYAYEVRDIEYDSLNGLFIVNTLRYTESDQELDRNNFIYVIDPSTWFIQKYELTNLAIKKLTTSPKPNRYYAIADDTIFLLEIGETINVVYKSTIRDATSNRSPIANLVNFPRYVSENGITYLASRFRDVKYSDNRLYVGIQSIGTNDYPLKSSNSWPTYHPGILICEVKKDENGEYIKGLQYTPNPSSERLAISSIDDIEVVGKEIYYSYRPSNIIFETSENIGQIDFGSPSINRLIIGTDGSLINHDSDTGIVLQNPGNYQYDTLASVGSIYDSFVRYGFGKSNNGYNDYVEIGDFKLCLNKLDIGVCDGTDIAYNGKFLSNLVGWSTYGYISADLGAKLSSSCGNNIEGPYIEQAHYTGSPVTPDDIVIEAGDRVKLIATVENGEYDSEVTLRVNLESESHVLSPSEKRTISYNTILNSDNILARVTGKTRTQEFKSRGESLIIRNDRILEYFEPSESKQYLNNLPIESSNLVVQVDNVIYQINDNKILRIEQQNKSNIYLIDKTKYNPLALVKSNSLLIILARNIQNLEYDLLIFDISKGSMTFKSLNTDSSNNPTGLRYGNNVYLNKRKDTGNILLSYSLGGFLVNTDVYNINSTNSILEYDLINDSLKVVNRQSVNYLGYNRDINGVAYDTVNQNYVACYNLNIKSENSIYSLDTIYNSTFYRNGPSISTFNKDGQPIGDTEIYRQDRPISGVDLNVSVDYKAYIKCLDVVTWDGKPHVVYLNNILNAANSTGKDANVFLPEYTIDNIYNNLNVIYSYPISNKTPDIVENVKILRYTKVKKPQPAPFDTI